MNGANVDTTVRLDKKNEKQRNFLSRLGRWIEPVFKLFHVVSIIGALLFSVTRNEDEILKRKQSVQTKSIQYVNNKRTRF